MVGNNDQEKGGCQIMDECRDNRAIVDNNEAQTLTSEDIDEMRRCFAYIFMILFLDAG